MDEHREKLFTEEQSVNFDSIVTGSEKMREIISVAREIAESEINVFITGQTGTGKELLARAIHNNSKYKNGPFVPVNCAGIPDTLIESELFGHEKGAFTDAREMKKGKFELAHGGTIFLDEVGDLSPSAQPKTLRILEEKKFERVGGQKQIHIDCRIISATNQNLVQKIEQGSFRNDLYYRLCESTLNLPSLIERKEDIPLLINSFIEEFNKKLDKNVQGASDVVKAYLMRHHWPGNIRELKSFIKIGMVLIKRERIWLEDLPFYVRLVTGENEHNIQQVDDTDMSLDYIEKKHISKVLKHVNDNKVKAANLLKISRPTLDRKIAKYNIKIR